MSSALRDALQRAKQAAGKGGSLNLLAKMDDHFLREGRRPKFDPDWGGKDVWHPSGIAGGVCSRLEVMKHFVKENSIELAASGAVVLDHSVDRGGISAILSRIFGAGNRIHRYYQNSVYGPMGLLYGTWLDLLSLDIDESKWHTHEGFMPDPEVFILEGLRRWWYVEPAVYSEEYNIGGHSDGLLIVDGEAIWLEIKSIHWRSFGGLMGAKPEHQRQLQFYMHCEPVLPLFKTRYAMPVRGVFIYVSKCPTGEERHEKEFMLAKDHTAVAAVFRSLLLIRRGIMEHSLPSRHTRCTSRAKAPAKNCPGSAMCFRLGEGKAGWVGLEELVQ